MDGRLDDGNNDDFYGARLVCDDNVCDIDESVEERRSSGVGSGSEKELMITIDDNCEGDNNDDDGELEGQVNDYSSGDFV